MICNPPYTTKFVHLEYPCICTKHAVSFVAFLPQMIITPFHTSSILFSRYLVVITSSFTHYKFVNSRDPNCKRCLLSAAEIASSVFIF